MWHILHNCEEIWKKGDCLNKQADLARYPLCGKCLNFVRFVKSMKGYVKPVVVRVEELAEGIYMASGASAEENVRGCKSIYMKGVFQKPTYSPITDGYKIGRGCEGCPAWNGSSCRFQSAPEEMNWDGDFRPSWEVAGHKPDEKGY